MGLYQSFCFRFRSADILKHIADSLLLCLLLRGLDFLLGLILFHTCCQFFAHPVQRAEKTRAREILVTSTQNVLSIEAYLRLHTGPTRMLAVGSLCLSRSEAFEYVSNSKIQDDSC